MLSVPSEGEKNERLREEKEGKPISERIRHSKRGKGGKRGEGNWQLDSLLWGGFRERTIAPIFAVMGKEGKKRRIDAPVETGRTRLSGRGGIAQGNCFRIGGKEEKKRAARHAFRFAA